METPRNSLRFCLWLAYAVQQASEFIKRRLDEQHMSSIVPLFQCSVLVGWRQVLGDPIEVSSFSWLCDALQRALDFIKRRLDHKRLSSLVQLWQCSMLVCRWLAIALLGPHRTLLVSVAGSCSAEGPGHHHETTEVAAAGQLGAALAMLNSGLSLAGDGFWVTQQNSLRLRGCAMQCRRPQTAPIDVWFSGS